MEPPFPTLTPTTAAPAAVAAAGAGLNQPQVAQAAAGAAQGGSSGISVGPTLSRGSGPAAAAVVPGPESDGLPDLPM
jgi:hypothetical protein